MPTLNTKTHGVSTSLSSEESMKESRWYTGCFQANCMANPGVCTRRIVHISNKGTVQRYWSYLSPSSNDFLARFE